MSLTANIQGGYIVTGVYDGNDTVVIQDASVYVVDGYNTYQELDYIYCTITDSDGNITTETDVSNTDGYIYYIDEIDVTGYPSGDITLTWVMTKGDSELTHDQVIEYSSPVDINLTADVIASRTNLNVSLDTIHQFNIVLQDDAGNRVDANGARIVFYDTTGSAIVETVSATGTGNGSGLFSVSHTLSSSLYSASLDRYQIYWEYQLTSGSNYTTVNDSLEYIQIYGSPGELGSGSLGYCTVTDVRTNYPFIDQYLSAYQTKQGEREIILQKAIYNVSQELDRQVKDLKVNRNILEQWCALQVVIDIITGFGPAMGRFQDSNLQIKHLKQKLFRIKQSILGKNRIVSLIR